MSFSAWKNCVCVFFSLCCQPCVRLRAACVGGLATMEVLTLQFGRVMSTEACNEYKRAYIVYRSSMNSLAIYALERKECRYHLRPKQHQLGHVCNHVLPKNPRYLANFLSEDFIYKSKVLAEKCHALFMSKQVLQRYAMGACLRWRDPWKNGVKTQNLSYERQISWHLFLIYQQVPRRPKTWLKKRNQISEPVLLFFAKILRKHACKRCFLILSLRVFGKIVRLICVFMIKPLKF